MLYNHQPFYEFRKTFHIGGFRWAVKFIGSVAIIVKPDDFPEHLPVPWESTNIFQLMMRELPPRPLFGPGVYSWVSKVERHRERLVTSHIRREILKPLAKERAKERRRRSQAKAPQRARRHRVRSF